MTYCGAFPARELLMISSAVADDSKG